MHSPIATYLTESLTTVVSDTSGELANYIPELAAVDPDKLAASIVMVDGEQYAAGDSDVEFTIQSISKPFVYALALADRGFDDVLAKVGVEPSGEPFNELSLEDGSGKPLNPMINAGAITTHSLVGPPGATQGERIAPGSRRDLLPNNYDAKKARILFVHAHPDDETSSTGATMAYYAQKGAEVYLLTATRGELGEVIPEELHHLEVGKPGCTDNGEALGEYRVGELNGALEALGVHRHLFLGQEPATAEGVPALSRASASSTSIRLISKSISMTSFASVSSLSISAWMALATWLAALSPIYKNRRMASSRS